MTLLLFCTVAAVTTLRGGGRGKGALVPTTHIWTLIFVVFGRFSITNIRHLLLIIIV